MTIIKLNKKAYQSRMYGRGIGGRYTKVLRQSGSGIGYGIVDSMGKEATKYVLGGWENQVDPMQVNNWDV